MGKRAVAEIETASLHSLTQLIQATLETAKATDFLISIPSPAQLMPPLDMQPLIEQRTSRDAGE